MSRKQSRKQRRKNKKTNKHQATKIHEQVQTLVVEQTVPERFVFVNEIADRFGLTPAAIRQWRRQGKIKLRKVFGTSGQYGMPESQLVKFINGESEV